MLWTVIGVWYLFASVVTFVAYGFDKRQAKRSAGRVRERTLHTFELFGGWPGGWVGQQVFRHKRRKAEYQLVFWSIVALHVAAGLAVVYGRRQ